MPPIVFRIHSLLVIVPLAACWRSSPAPAGASVRSPSTEAATVVSANAIPDGRPPLTAAILVETIETSYLGALRRCYKARLKHDPAARGRVIVTFTVDGKGRLSDGRASGVGKQIESCVERAMTRWEFPPARDRDGAPIEATFRLALQLTSV